jgi:hypothetical protein
MKKYAFANVKIPLEILSNGNFELLKEHIQVEFTQCKELPPKQELNMDFSSILNDLFKQEKINMNIEKQEEREIKIKEFTEDDEPENEEQSQASDKEEEPEQSLKKQEEQEEHEELVVLASEIKTNKNQKKNTSFKNRKNSHNYTNKVYNN